MGRARRLRYRHLRRTVMALLVFAAAAAVGAVAGGQLLASPAFARRLAGWLAPAASRAVGGTVRMEAARLEVWPPAVVLEGLEVEASGVRARCAAARVELAGTRLAPGEVELGGVWARDAEVIVEGAPVAAPPSGRRWLRVGVRRLAVEGVALEGRRLPGRVRLAARDLRLGWTADREEVRGFARAREVAVRVPGLEEVRVAAAARMAAGRDGLRLERVRLRGRGVDLAGSAVLAAGPPRVTAAGGVDLAELDRVVRARAGLSGDARVHLTLDGGTLAADLRVPRLAVAGFTFHAVDGRIELGGGGLSGTLHRAEAWGGTVRGSYRLHRLARPWPHRARASGTGIVLGRFLAALGVPPAGIGAAADVEAELAWDGRKVGAGHGYGRARLRPRAPGLPAAGAVEVRLAGDGMLRFSGEDLSLGSHSVRWTGPLTLGDWVPSWSVAASGGELAELVPVVNAWIGAQVLPRELAGRADLEVELAGPFSAPRVAVRLDAAPLALGTIAVDRVAAQLEVSQGSLEVASAVARLGEGAVRAAGEVRWGGEGARLGLQLAGRGVPLERVLGWAGLPPLLAGSLAFSGPLEGPVAAPRGAFAVGLVNLEAAGLPLGSGNGTVELGGGAFTLRSCRLEGGLELAGRWGVTAGEVELSGRWPDMDPAALSPLAAGLLGGNCTVEGSLEVRRDGLAHADVGVAAPGGRGELLLERTGGVLRLDLEGIGSARLDLERAADGSLVAAGRAEVASVGGLLARLFGERAPAVDGALTARLRGAWPAGGRPRLQVAPDPAELEVAGGPVALGEGAEVQLGNGLDIRGVRLRTAAGEARLDVAVAADGSLTGRFEGAADAALLAPLAPGWRPAGAVRGALEARGTVAGPRLHGELAVRRGALRIGGGLPVTGIEGRVRLEGRRVELDVASARVLGGTSSARGAVELERGGGLLALEGEATAIRFEPLDGLRLVLAGDWRLSGPVERPTLSGELAVERGTLARQEELDALLAGWFGPGAAAGRALPDLPELRLHVVADRSVEARTPFVHLLASADLEVRGTPARPGLLGTVELAEPGDLLLRGVRYEVERAALTFTDPDRIWPRIEVRGRTWVDIYAISVTVVGTPDRLVPTLVSDPPLETADILSLLSLGRREERGGGLGATLASTILTRQLNAELERRASALLAVDQLRVDPFAESATGNPTARLTVVKQLSPSWTVVLQTNLSSNREEVVVSRWYLERGLFLEATRDADGSYSLDLKLRRRY